VVPLTYKAHQAPNGTEPGRFMIPPINPQDVANPTHVTIHKGIPHTPHNSLTRHPLIGANNEGPIPSVSVTLLNPPACAKLSGAEVLVSSSGPAFPVPRICFSDVTFEFSLMLPTVIKVRGIRGP